MTIEVIEKKKVNKAVMFYNAEGKNSMFLIGRNKNKNIWSQKFPYDTKGKNI